MKKLGLIALAMVMALGALGVGYAWWTDQLTISGTVGTGKLEVTFTAASATEVAEVGGYDAAQMTAGFTPKTASFAVVDAYPGYAGNIAMNVTNTGTVPVKVDTFNFVPNGNMQVFQYMTLNTWTLSVDGVVQSSGTNENFTGLNPAMVLDSGKVATLSINFSFDTDAPNDTLELQNAGFNITVDIEQFNAP